MEAAFVSGGPAAADRRTGQVDHGVVAFEVEVVGCLPAVDAGRGVAAGPADAGGGHFVFREQGR